MCFITICSSVTIRGSRSYQLLSAASTCCHSNLIDWKYLLSISSAAKIRTGIDTKGQSQTYMNLCVKHGRHIYQPNALLLG